MEIIAASTQDFSGNADIYIGHGGRLKQNSLSDHGGEEVINFLEGEV